MLNNVTADQFDENEIQIFEYYMKTKYKTPESADDLRNGRAKVNRRQYEGDAREVEGAG